MTERTSVAGIAWPALHHGPTATVHALAWQLEQTQWWPAERLRAAQARQLRLLLHHAATTSAYYEARFAAAGCEVAALATDLPPATWTAAWATVPELSRHALIDAGPRLLSRRYPAQHGDAPEVSSSRSTGAAVRVRVPAVVSTFWDALTLRDHVWHRRDLSARLAAIRHVADGSAPPPDGARAAGWGPSTAALAPDAPLSVLSIAATTEEHVAWLLREDPTYLLTYPTVLGAIMRLLAARGLRLPSLRQVRTISEALSADTRAMCHDVLGVPLVDTYSAQEVGYIALQCPDHPHYHVQAERLLVEIVADDGTPCSPGQIGRVVVTDLHNFATPLIRYDLGDYAEVGAPCPCGRGLPVLARILGRRRAMLTYPDGHTAWPVFTVACRAAAPYRELQLVQDTVDRLRVRLVPTDEALTAAHRQALVAALHAALGHPFTIEVEVVAQLDRSPAGKLDELVSHVAPLDAARSAPCSG